MLTQATVTHLPGPLCYPCTRSVPTPVSPLPPLLPMHHRYTHD